MKLTHLIWHCFWSFQDELRALQIYQSQMKALSAEHRSWTLVDSELRKELKKIGIVEQTHHGETMGYPDVLDPQLKTFFSDTVIGGNRAIRRAFVAETLREMTATAIALQRFQMRHGNYPSNLSQLVPEFLPKLPIDYMDGQMLRYRLEADSTFTLYSIGNDGIDGNGSAPPRKEDARRSWLTQPDWVWPRLASPAEIQEYEAAQAAKNARKGARRSVRQKPATTNITNSVNQ